MVYLLYLEKLDPARRTVAALGLGVFLFIESLMLLAKGFASWAYWLVAVGVAIAVFGIVRYAPFSRSHLSLEVCPDASLYLAILIGTYFISGEGGGELSFVPSGKYLRLDLEMFVVAVLFVTVATLVPALNDPRVAAHSQFRPVESKYLAFIPFGYRRSLSGVAVFPLLAVVFSALLWAGHSIGHSGIIALIFGVSSAWVFQAVYGYRSYIMIVSCPFLFGIVFVACLLRTNYAKSLIPYLPNMTFFAPAILAVWGVAVSVIWRYSKPDEEHIAPRPRQKFAHTIFLSILVVGVLLTYRIWVIPLV